MEIFVDMDAILVDLLGAWISDYNSEHGDLITVADIKTWDMHNHVKNGKGIYEIIDRTHYFDKLDPLPGAVEGYKALQDAGHKVRVLSSPFNPDSARAKYEWCERHLGIRYDNVILMHDKHLLAAPGRVLFDDRGSTLAKWAARGGIPATIRYPYNSLWKFYSHGDYTDTASAWEAFVFWVGNF